MMWVVWSGTIKGDDLRFHAVFSSFEASWEWIQARITPSIYYSERVPRDPHPASAVNVQNEPIADELHGA